jgi:hypothetical protein
MVFNSLILNSSEVVVIRRKLFFRRHYIFDELGSLYVKCSLRSVMCAESLLGSMNCHNHLRWARGDYVNTYRSYSMYSTTDLQCYPNSITMIWNFGRSWNDLPVFRKPGFCDRISIRCVRTFHKLCFVVFDVTKISASIWSSGSRPDLCRSWRSCRPRRISTSQPWTVLSV